MTRPLLAAVVLASLLAGPFADVPIARSQIGPPLEGTLSMDPEGWAFHPSITAAADGTIFVAWSQHRGPSNWEHVGTRVKRWANGRWESLGGRLGHSLGELGARWPEGYAPSIAVAGQTPYVAWYEGGGYGWGQAGDRAIGSSVFVAHWDGAKWVYDRNPEQPHGALNTSPGATAREPKLATVAGVLHAAWVEARRRPNTGTGYDVIAVKRLTDGRWVQEGPEISLSRGSTAAAITDHSIADVGGIAYVAWSEFSRAADSGRASVQVVRREAHDWVQVGGALNTSRDRHPGYLAMAAMEGSPHVAWQERTQAGNNQIYASRWDGRRWMSTGGALNSNPERGEAGRPALASDGARLWLAWTEGAPSQRSGLYLRSLAPSGWSAPSGALNVDPALGAADSPALAAGGGHLYLIWAEKNPPPAAKQVYVRMLQ